MRKTQTWQRQDQSIHPELKSWLYASGSLTRQLTELAGGVFWVQPLKEYFQRLNFNDSQWMKMPYRHTSWVRDCYLYGSDEQPWVKARSIFPILSLQGRARLFQHIGSKPIGWYLFQRTEPVCERRVIWLEEGWTRQSCYTWHGCKFIVQETFLPAFEQFLNTQTQQTHG
ncbi:chorismate lyase [Acinetobacter chinensis]|uniref:Probable chorismate pyruvate-lyase n=1 Tax=Acinetobacter chinensis TaxID=2004650 RepID=A0ABU3WBC6_9GAMM|nr:chorismate lyase [Acinetobacter chinensis]MDV2467714.1 chorismate lyase [Acinetobacter chinensis]